MNKGQKRLEELKSERDTLKETIEVLEELQALKDKWAKLCPQPVIVPLPYPVYPYPYSPTWQIDNQPWIRFGPVMCKTLVAGSTNGCVSGSTYYASTDCGVYTDDSGGVGALVS